MPETISDVTQSVLADIGGENSPPTQDAETAPRVQEESAPEQQAEPQQAEPQEKETPTETPADDSVEFDYGGRTHRLPKDRAAQALQAYAQLLDQANQQTQQQPETPEQEPEPEIAGLDDAARQVLDQYYSRREQKLMKKLQELEQKVSSTEDRALQKEIQNEMREKVSADPTLSKLEKGDREKLGGLALFLQQGDPNMSVDTAIKKVSGLIKGLSEKTKAQYVEEKISQSQKGVVTGKGSAPAPGPKKVSRQEFMSGDLGRQIIDELRQQQAMAT